MTRYVILGKEAVFLRPNLSKKQATRKYRSRLANVTLAKEDDLGVNDVQFEERSHVGYLLKAGDVCLGYDLTETQFVEDEVEEMRVAGKLPEVIVVRKLYGGVAANDANAAKQRIWRLERLDVEIAESMRARTSKKDAEMDDVDEEDFMREVEADSEMRRNINLYKSGAMLKKDSNEEEMKDKETVEINENQDDEEDEDDQQVKLDELLDGLVLDEGPDPEDVQEDDVLGEEEAWQAAAGFLSEGEKAAKDGISYVARTEANQMREKDAAVPVAGNVFGQQYMDSKFKFT
jgi:nonsense-mediated mRNA decay protein 3